MPSNDLGPLATALAKAQSDFATVTRDKTVTVTTKSGGSYKFSYAPLETILAAVRKPLSDNGLVLVQILNEAALETTLLHESGASLSGRIGLPDTNDIQGFGSAVTYLRRYAIQAMLGIAAEDDDDGNQAAGNTAAVAATKGEETLELVGDINRSGTVKKGDGRHSNLEVHETPDGHHIGFRLEVASESAIPQVCAEGAIGRALFMAIGEDTSKFVGKRAHVWGRLYQVKQSGRRPVYRLILTKIKTDEFVIPAEEPEQPVDAPSIAPGQEALPLDKLDPEERALIAGGLE